MSQKNFYVKLNENFSKLLKKKILAHGIKKINLTIKPKSFYHGIWQNRYNIKDLLEAAKLFDSDFEQLYNNIDSIYHRTGKQRGKNASSMKLPKNSEDFKELFYIRNS